MFIREGNYVRLCTDQRASSTPQKKIVGMTGETAFWPMKFLALIVSDRRS